MSATARTGTANYFALLDSGSDADVSQEEGLDTDAGDSSAEEEEDEEDEEDEEENLNGEEKEELGICVWSKYATLPEELTVRLLTHGGAYTDAKAEHTRDREHLRQFIRANLPIHDPQWVKFTRSLHAVAQRIFTGQDFAYPKNNPSWSAYDLSGFSIKSIIEIYEMPMQSLRYAKLRTRFRIEPSTKEVDRVTQLFRKRVRPDIHKKQRSSFINSVGLRQDQEYLADQRKQLSTEETGSESIPVQSVTLLSYADDQTREYIRHSEDVNPKNSTGSRRLEGGKKPAAVVSANSRQTTSLINRYPAYSNVDAIQGTPQTLTQDLVRSLYRTAMRPEKSKTDRERILLQKCLLSQVSFGMITRYSNAKASAEKLGDVLYFGLTDPDHSPLLIKSRGETMLRVDVTLSAHAKTTEVPLKEGDGELRITVDFTKFCVGVTPKSLVLRTALARETPIGEGNTIQSPDKTLASLRSGPIVRNPGEYPPIQAGQRPASTQSSAGGQLAGHGSSEPAIPGTTLLSTDSMLVGSWYQPRGVDRKPEFDDDGREVAGSGWGWE